MAWITEKTVSQYVNREVPCRVAPTFTYIRPYIAGKTLDVGTGTGEYLERFPEGSTGVDASAINVNKCREKGLHILQADINSGLPFVDQSFQTVFCSHVIGHVDSPLYLLREASRILRPGGRLILALPVEKTIVRLVREDYFKDHETHLYGLSVECMDRLIRQAGLSPVKVCYQFPLLSRVPWLAKRLKNVAYAFCQYSSTMYWFVAIKE